MKTKVIVVLTVLAVCSSVFAQNPVEKVDRRSVLIEKEVYEAVNAWMKQERIHRDSTNPMKPDYLRIAAYGDSIRQVIEGEFIDEVKPDFPQGVTFKSAISGRVFETDGVTPIAGIPVRVFNTSWSQQGWIETDGQGRYLIGNLSEGDYYIEAEGWISSKGDVYYGEYYDNAETKPLASQVAVADSDTTVGINFTLARKAAISGRVTEVGEGAIAGTMVCAYNMDWECVGGTQTNASGYYTIYGLTGSQYYIFATGYIVGEGEFFLEEYYDNASTKGGASVVSVSPPNTAEGINFNLTRGFHIWTWTSPSVGWVNIDPQKLVYAPGDEVELYAEVSEIYPDYQFDHWGGHVSGTQNPKTITMDAEKEVDAYFVEITGPSYNLNLSVDPPGSGEIGREPVHTTYDSGSTVSLYAEAFEGWAFKGWAGDHDGTENPTEVLMDFDKYITAQFGHTLTLEMSPEGGGEVCAEPEKSIYNHEEVVEITAEAAAGYVFTSWSGGGIENLENATTTVLMDENRTVTANFESQSVVLTMVVIPESKGETDPGLGEHEYDLDTVVEIFAEGVDGYRFKKWEGGGIADPFDPSTTVTMDESRTVEAIFEPDIVVLEMKVNPAETGTTVPETGEHVYETGDVVEITATPAEGYHFYKWKGTGVADPYSVSTTVTMDENREITAKFESNTVVLTLQAWPEGAGTTVPELGEHACEWNDVVEITAIPAEGYAFWKWEGCGISDPNSASTTVAMTECRTVKAKFQLISSVLTMEVAPEGGGTTDPEVGSHTCEVGEVVEIRAYPSEGYRFVKWYGGGIQSHYQDQTTVTMDESRTVKAKFELESVTLTVKVFPEEAGYTEPQVGVHEYTLNETIEIAASAADGFIFDKWTGGGITHSESANTTVLMDESRTIIAHFKSPDTESPTLINCYPKPFSRFVPRNTGLQFIIKDCGSGVDIESIHVWIDGILVVEDGTLNAGEQLCLGTPHKVLFKYRPAEPFNAESDISVRIQVQDLAEPPNSCDTSYTFTTAAIKLAQCDTARVDSTGGNVKNDSTGIHMNIPPNALTSTVIITVSHADTTPPLPPGFQGVQESFHFGPDGLEFDEPITVKIPYSPELLAASGVEDPHDLIILYFHTSTGEWSQLTIVEVDEENMCIYVIVEEFCYLTFGKDEATGIEPPADETLPESCTLFPNYPNPFNPETRVAFQIIETCHVNVSVYDATGRLIRTLINDTKQPGQYETLWDGKNTEGMSVSSGMYLLKMEAGSHRAFRKMSLLK